MEKDKKQIPTPVAIIVAGFLIMIGIVLTKSNTNTTPQTPKTLSEQVGVSKASLDACIKGTDLTALNDSITKSVNDAMSSYPDNQRGTPYSVVIGLNGVKTDILGAESYPNLKKIIDDAMVGKVSKAYTGNVALSEPTDHVQGNPNATVTIIEYSDFECPYCKQFYPVMEQVMKDYNGNVRWIYRHYPIHQHSFEELVAANCVAKIGGEDAFWKYGDLLFGLLNTPTDSISNQL